MPKLEDPRREQFANLVASGQTPTESYRLCGYSKKGAAQSSSRLNKDANVAARITELRALAAEIPIASRWLNEHFVLNGLKTTFERALADSKYSDAIAALNLMGKKLGLWIEKIDHTVQWDGDPAKLNERQLGILTQQLERIAWGDEAERIKAERDQHLKDTGLLIEATADIAPDIPADTLQENPVESTETTEGMPSNPPASKRSWADITPEKRRKLAKEWQLRFPMPDMPKEDRIKWLDEHWPLQSEGYGEW